MANIFLVTYIIPYSDSDNLGLSSKSLPKLDASTRSHVEFEATSEKENNVITRAILEFHYISCVRFISRTNEEDFIHISREGGCSSYGGRNGGAQILNLSPECLYLGIIMHELMQVLGFVHEHTRHDRDEYVTIIWDNIKDDNFLKLDWYDMSVLNERYDYESILHYHRFTFSKNPGKSPTLEPKKRRARIGQRKYLSAGDIRKIKKLYKCAKL
nr:zinc metalloproteinase nas-7-like [Parasteatoda tepidariorum]